MLEVQMVKGDLFFVIFIKSKVPKPLQRGPKISGSELHQIKYKSVSK